VSATTTDTQTIRPSSRRSVSVPRRPNTGQA
jgi:hypothetical protein